MNSNAVLSRYVYTIDVIFLFEHLGKYNVFEPGV